MTSLPHTFRHAQFDFTLIKRQGDVALYFKTKPGWKSPPLYEVFIVQKIPEQTVFGKIVLAHEKPPTISEWGRLGWSFTHGDLAGAEKRFLEITQRIEQANAAGI
jgi:hypothetical protein